MTTRADFDFIAGLVAPGSRVLDLGCGDGELLHRLQRDHGCKGTGVEIDPALFLTALARGVNVIDLDLNTELGEFADNSYDMVILSRTLQNVDRPAVVLQHMYRIARYSIVSMPNFAHWQNRLSLLCGRMPISRDLPFEWHDSPNLHYTSLRDLEPWLTSLGFSIQRRITQSNAGRQVPDALANLLASSAIYVLQRR